MTAPADYAPPEDQLPATADVALAARILRTTVNGIRTRSSRGKMPRPICSKPLVWRTADLLVPVAQPRRKR